MATVNITCANDADFYCVFQYVSLVDEVEVPIDITGVSLEMMLRRRAEDATALMRLATDSGEIALTDPFNGRFSVMIRQIELVRLGLGDFDHSCIMTRTGNKTRIWSGVLTNNAGATR
jgi:hypothetical protein